MQKAPPSKGSWLREAETEGLYNYHFAGSINRQYVQTIPPSFAAQNPPPFAQGGLEIFLGNPSDRTLSPSLM